jgi:hypothetical protein
VSELVAHADAIQQSLTERPVRTTAEAIERIDELTGIRRGLTQTRTFFAWPRLHLAADPRRRACPRKSR